MNRLEIKLKELCTNKITYLKYKKRMNIHIANKQKQALKLSYGIYLVYYRQLNKYNIQTHPWTFDPNHCI